MVLSRIEDTVIYLKVDSEYKDSVDSILKKLGYWYNKSNYNLCYSCFFSFYRFTWTKTHICGKIAHEGIKR